MWHVAALHHYPGLLVNVARGSPARLSGTSGTEWVCAWQELLASMLGFPEAGLLPDMSELGKCGLEMTSGILGFLPIHIIVSKVITAGDFVAALVCLSLL